MTRNDHRTYLPTQTSVQKLLVFRRAAPAALRRQKQKRELALKHCSMWDALSKHATVKLLSFLPALSGLSTATSEQLQAFRRRRLSVSGLRSASRHASCAAVLTLHQLVWLTEISRSNDADSSNAGPV